MFKSIKVLNTQKGADMNIKHEVDKNTEQNALCQSKCFEPLFKQFKGESLMISTTRGFSLLEVLTASIILAIGLLGLASIHFEGLKKGNESFHKTMASIATGDLIERMRANIDGVDQGLYDQGIQSGSTSNPNCLGGVANGDRTSSDGAPDLQCENLAGDPEQDACLEKQNFYDDKYAAEPTFGDTECNAEQIAQQDLIEWEHQVAQTLPGGQSAVCRTSAPGAIGSALNCDGLGNIIVVNINWRNKQGSQEVYRVSFKP
jgi:prepilin-type N-terminal cleavage/methylation domain-containing protein